MPHQNQPHSAGSGCDAFDGEFFPKYQFWCFGNCFSPSCLCRGCKRQLAVPSWQYSTLSAKAGFLTHRGSSSFGGCSPDFHWTSHEHSYPFHSYRLERQGRLGRNRSHCLRRYRPGGECGLFPWLNPLTGACCPFGDGARLLRGDGHEPFLYARARSVGNDEPSAS